MAGTIIGDILIITIGGITRAIIMVMCGMTLGIIPTSMTIIRVGIMVIIMLIILTLAQANQAGVEEARRHSPIIVPRLQPLHVVSHCLLALRAHQAHRARVSLQVA